MTERQQSGPRERLEVVTKPFELGRVLEAAERARQLRRRPRLTA